MDTDDQQLPVASRSSGRTTNFGSTLTRAVIAQSSYIAAILRDELDRVEQRFPNMKPMVVIGHSMGGSITRSLLTDSGDQLCLKIFGRPP